MYGGGVFSEPVTHFWSLCVEEQFYLFWPLLLVFLKKTYQLHLILGMILIGLVSRLVYIGMELPNYQNFIWSTPACFDCLGLGALLAWLKLNKENLLSRILKLYYIPLFLSFLFWILAKLAGNTEESFLFGSFGRLIAGLTGFFLVGLGAFGWKTWYGKMMGWNWLRFIGRISYGLYIYHWILYILLYDYISNWVRENFSSTVFILDKLRYNSYIVSFFVLTAISLIISFISYKVIEKPLLNLKERFS